MLRVTPQRQAVLDVLIAAHDHPTAAQVFDRVRGQQPGIGAATVYRTLSLLVAAGQARVLSLGEGASARYDANVSRHDHVLCVDCGAAMDVEAPLPVGALADMSSRTGYDLTEYDVQFRGRCPSCDRLAHRLQKQSKSNEKRNRSV
ncbi:MAG TPA: transcriptional repressor [Mycobacteriales bacterium]|jgi:Fur family ferric uptake transcriptional regulator/Fur family peroxide stress response transcriptional regulator|nr:transcriptional repressor [Mycobacteriales bacterium]